MKTKIIAGSVLNMDNLKNPKISYIFNKTVLLSVIFDNCSVKDKKIFKEEQSIGILKILGLMKNINEYQVSINYLK